MQVWTQLKFLPSLEGVSKGPGRRETLCLRGEKKFLIGYQAPEDSPDLGAVKFLCLDIDRSFHRVPLPSWRYWGRPRMLENGSLCGIQERE